MAPHNMFTNVIYTFYQKQMVVNIMQECFFVLSVVKTVYLGWDIVQFIKQWIKINFQVCKESFVDMWDTLKEK